MRKICIAVFLISFALIGCSSPLDKKYDASTVSEDVESINASNKITEEDAEILGRYLLMARMNNIPLQDKTYGELLDQGKSLKGVDFQLAGIELEEKGKAARLDSIAVIKVINMVSQQDPAQMEFDFSVLNKRTKAIKLIVGTLKILDENNVELRSEFLELEQLIKPTSYSNLKQIVPYSLNIEIDKSLAATPFSKLKCRWISDKIQYEDGIVID